MRGPAPYPSPSVIRGRMIPNDGQKHYSHFSGGRSALRCERDRQNRARDLPSALKDPLTGKANAAARATAWDGNWAAALVWSC
jgi:hypothetical protein